MDLQETGDDRNNGSAILLGVEDVRAMLALASAVHAAGPDPAVGKRVLLKGVCRLVGADSAMAVVNRLDDVTARPVVVSAVHARVQAGRRTGPNPDAARRRRRAAKPAPGWGAASAGRSNDARGEAGSPGEQCRRGAGLDYCIDAPLELDGVRLVAWLTVGGPAGDQRRFAPRHRAIIELLHAATRWLYAHDLLLASPEALALPPRLSDVLRRLLAGDGDAQVAATLRLDAAIVRAGVASLCRHFRMRDRAQLVEMGRSGGGWRGPWPGDAENAPR